jgi:hypothetical protein
MFSKTISTEWLEITELELKQKGCYQYHEKLKDFVVFEHENLACPLSLLENHSEIRILKWIKNKRTYRESGKEIALRLFSIN